MTPAPVMMTGEGELIQVKGKQKREKTVGYLEDEKNVSVNSGAAVEKGTGHSWKR